MWSSNFEALEFFLLCLIFLNDIRTVFDLLDKLLNFESNSRLDFHDRKIVSMPAK